MRRLMILILVSGMALPMSGMAQTPPELSRYERQSRDVTVIRDKWGIPHIYGKTDADAVFGLLYTECENDFSRVEKNYLEMLGREAEAYGEGFIYNDIMMRLIYDSVQAKADYAQSPAWMHKLLDAFADGINYYLYRHRETKPLVLKHFEPWYALMFTDGSVSATSTGGIRAEEIKDFYGGDHRVGKRGGRADAEQMVLADRGMAGSDHGDEMAARGDDEGNGTEVTAFEERETGSNGFAIAPARTAAGNALLYINPHVPYYFRMEVQMASEEGLNAYGAVTWGQFFIYQGFNAHCGWMHTSSYADVADVYAEKTSRKGDGWVYEYEGQAKAVSSKPLTIWYQKDGGMQSLPVTGYFTHHGPVLASRDGKWLSLKEYNRSLNALVEAWQITKANTFAEYKTAMTIRANTTNNTVYADDQGNIAYWHGNFMPMRDQAYNWALPVDGSIAATEWKGLHGLDEIVHVYNPPTGWIQNCNSTPFSLSGSSSPVRSQYPSYMAPDGENFRALNAVRLLSGARQFTLDSLIAKGYDHYLTAFDLLIPALLDAYDHAPGDLLKEGGLPDSVVKKYGLAKAVKEAIGYLRTWDRRSAERSVATTLAVEWGTRMTKYAPKPRVPEDATHAVENLQAAIAHSTPAQKVTELAATILDLQQRYAMWWKIEWGDLCHYQRLTGKIEETYDDQRSSMGLGLVSSAFGALPSVQSKLMKGTKIRYAYSGNSFVAAVEFGKRLTARSTVTGGESSDPDSPHFTDQAYGFFRGEMKDVLFYKEDVLAAMEEQYHPGEARVYSQSADLVLLGGKIITLQEPGNVAHAVAIRDGKIVAVGSDDSIRTYMGVGTKLIELHGRTVVPGFNDVHQHPQPVYAWDKPYASLRLDTVSSMASLISLLQRKAAITPKGMLITGIGYNEVKLGGQPIRDSLDKASTDHPILIAHASGHISAANSYMLAINGIEKDTKDPSGGAFERYKDGVPDGIVKESARQLLSSKKIIHAPNPTREEELEGYRIYFHNMLAGGLTSIGDCWVTPEKVAIYKSLTADHFPLRFNLYIGVDYLDQLISGSIPRESSDYLRINGVKFFHGNSLSGKTCWLYEPYDTVNPATGKKDYYGIPPGRSQGSLDSLVLKIHRAGLQIACHSNGDREIDMVIAAIEKAQQTDYRPDMRHRIEHCSITNASILERIKKDSIFPVFHCYINELGRQLQVYGEQRLAMLMPTRTALDMQIPFAFHSDYPISRYEAMIRLESAVNRETKDGVILGANQRIGVEEAIKAYTVGGAYTTHEENKKGRIVAGQLADLLILDKDPTAVDPHGISSIRVMTTIVGGKIAFEQN